MRHYTVVWVTQLKMMSLALVIFVKPLKRMSSVLDYDYIMAAVWDD